MSGSVPRSFITLLSVLTCSLALTGEVVASNDCDLDAEVSANLESLSTEELFSIWQQLRAGKPHLEILLNYIPLEELLKTADVIVEGFPVSTTPDRESLIEAIQGCQLIFICNTVTLQVIDSYPPLNINEIEIYGRWALHEGHYFLVLRRTENGFVPLDTFRGNGIWDCRDNRVMLPLEPRTSLEREAAWRSLRVAYDAVRGQLDAGAAEELARTLETGTIEEACLALVVLKEVNSPLLTEQTLMNTIESRFAALTMEDVPFAQAYGFRCFAKLALEALYPLASSSTVQSVLSLFRQDRSNRYANGFDDIYLPGDVTHTILKYALKYPDSDRITRVWSLLGKNAIYTNDAGERVAGEQLLRLDVQELKVIAKTPGLDIDAFLYDLFRDPKKHVNSQQAAERVAKMREEVMKTRTKALREFLSTSSER